MVPSSPSRPAGLRPLSALKGWLAPAGAFLAVLGVVLSHHAGQSAIRRHALEGATRITAEQVALRIESALEERFDHFDAFAAHGGERLLDPAFFQRLAGRLVERQPELQAVNWIDSTCTIRITVPAAGNEAALDRRLLDHPSAEVRQRVRRALESDRVVATPMVPLLQGGMGLVVYRRCLDGQGRFAGLLNGVFRIETLLDEILPEAKLKSAYSIALRDASGASVYERPALGGRRDDLEGEFAVGRPFRVGDESWTFTMAPSASHPARLADRNDRWTPWIGLLLALVVAGLTRRQSLQSLRLEASEERFRTLFEESLDGIFIADGDGRLVEVNEAALKIFGFEHRTDVVGRKLSSFYRDPEERDRVIARLTEHGSIQDENIVLKRRDGQDVLCRVSATPRIGSGGRSAGLQGILSDVSEQHRVREQLRQSQKMDAIGQLAGGVAHDFNNLLTVISGNAEMAQLQLGEDGPASLELGEIRQTAARATNLTRQLLAFSRQQVVRPRLVDSNAVVRDLERLLARLIGETIELRTELAPRPWPVRVDPAQLEQVLLNLALNARDSMPRGGRLTIRTRNVVDGGSDWLELEVEDTGQGIDPAIAHRIFEPFFTTKSEGDGTGLGLATVYGVLQQNGGEISVDSRPGLGSRFRARLPRAEGDVEQAATPAPAAALPSGSETLLLVEDEPSLRRMAVDALRRQGYRVYEAEDGQQADEVLRARGEEVALVVSDLVMPRMGGLELLQRMRERGLRTPAVFMSGYSTATAGGDGALPENTPLLQKPFPLAELLEAVRKRLDETR